MAVAPVKKKQPATATVASLHPHKKTRFIDINSSFVFKIGSDPLWLINASFPLEPHLCAWR